LTFVPQSPEGPPPLLSSSFDEEIPDENQKYRVGGMVHLRGDSKPHRLWKIKDIGPKFMAIETVDGEYLTDTNKIMVVTETDVYPVVVINTGGENSNNGGFKTKIPAHFFGGGYPTNNNIYPNGQGYPSINMGGGGGMGGNGNINITPIINVGGGGGGGGFPEQTTPLNQSSHLNHSNSFMSGGGDNGSFKFKETTGGNEKLLEEKKDVKGENSLMDGIKSIGGILVKKLGGL
jgi:hypothetical protein